MSEKKEKKETKEKTTMSLTKPEKNVSKETEVKEQDNILPKMRKFTDEDKKEGQTVILAPTPNIRCFFEDKVMEGVYGTVIKGNNGKLYLRSVVMMIAEIDEISKYEDLFVPIEQENK